MKKILSILFALLWVISLNAQVLTVYKSGRVLYCTAYTDSIVATRALPNAATESAFAISDNSYVCFSPGNLQYHIATDTWRFADYQYDYVAADITDTTYTGWIDLFGWGTGNNPTNVEDANSKFTDWGTNAIGTDVANTWRTLTLDEWLYLFQHTRWTLARVNGILGFMLLPDSFETPVGLAVSILGDGNLTDASKNYSERTTPRISTTRTNLFCWSQQVSYSCLLQVLVMVRSYLPVVRRVPIGRLLHRRHQNTLHDICLSIPRKRLFPSMVMQVANTDTPSALSATCKSRNIAKNGDIVRSIVNLF